MVVRTAGHEENQATSLSWRNISSANPAAMARQTRRSRHGKAAAAADLVPALLQDDLLGPRSWVVQTPRSDEWEGW